MHSGVHTVCPCRRDGRPCPPPSSAALSSPSVAPCSLSAPGPRGCPPGHGPGHGRGAAAPPPGPGPSHGPGLSPYPCPQAAPHAGSESDVAPPSWRESVSGTPRDVSATPRDVSAMTADERRLGRRIWNKMQRSER